MQLRNGIALVARLLRSASDRGVDLRTSTRVVWLLRSGEAVRGALLSSPDGEQDVRARCGVVLAARGFPHDVERRRAMFPVPDEHWTLAVSSATGDGVRLGESVGGKFDEALAAPGCPVALVRHSDGALRPVDTANKGGTRRC